MVVLQDRVKDQFRDSTAEMERKDRQSLSKTTSVLSGFQEEAECSGLNEAVLNNRKPRFLFFRFCT